MEMTQWLIMFKKKWFWFVANYLDDNLWLVRKSGLMGNLVIFEWAMKSLVYLFR